MENNGEDAAARAAVSIAAAIRRAEIALENVKQSLNEDRLEDFGAKAAATLLGEAEALVAQSEALTRVQAEVSGAVRRNPVGALAVAFGAGLLLALLTRG
jgi:hypothetical protein